RAGGGVQGAGERHPPAPPARPGCWWLSASASLRECGFFTTRLDPERRRTMLNDKAVRGSNFTCFHAGPMEGRAQLRLEPPDVPLPVRGKVFLRNLLGSAGLEMSLNVVPPGKSMPFLHRHQQNEEVYVVVAGRGQFLVDGECIDVAEGSVVRISPPAARG